MHAIHHMVPQISQTTLERFAAHRDRRQRIVDFVRHPRGQKTDASQLLAPHHLLGPLADLAIEVVANLLKAGRHVIHRIGQLAHFIFGLEANAVVEVTGSDFPRTCNKRRQRPGNPFTK